MPRNTCHATKVATSWAEDHVAISGIYSIDRTPTYSLCGKFDNGFWNREWGYPQIGVYFANCPSGGHDLLCLDYRGLSSGEEPSVVHVGQEDNYRITPVAADFESFIRGLTNEECFELD
ncbi:SMI1/KNR4 family protein [Parasedimentitalea maritima]|uniref:SMI1/KNR4 family protein n=1 Tax=Parasedimentitalea maritima TaxID=2578117 RepID=UPI001AD97D5A